MIEDDFVNPADDPIAEAIDAAEDVADPLEGLAEKTAADPGAPFTPDVLEALAALKADDRAAFEALRAKLKKAGCRVTTLDEAIAEANGTPGGRGPTQADILIELAENAALFHAPDGTGFADLDIDGHRETWAIRSKGFRRWLTRRYFEERGGAPNSEALKSALDVIEANADFNGPEQLVHIRVGGIDNRLYLDLGDKTWRAVEIDANGWRVKITGKREPCARCAPAPRTVQKSVAQQRVFGRRTVPFILPYTVFLLCARNFPVQFAPSTNEN